MITDPEILALEKMIDVMSKKMHDALVRIEGAQQAIREGHRLETLGWIDGVQYELQDILAVHKTACIIGRI